MKHRLCLACTLLLLVALSIGGCTPATQQVASGSKTLSNNNVQFTTSTPSPASGIKPQQGGTPIPGIAPLPKWQPAFNATDVDFINGAAMQVSSDGVMLDVHAVYVLDERVIVFFTTEAPKTGEVALPATAFLIGEGGEANYPALAINELERNGTLALGVASFSVTNNRAPRLALEVTRMGLRSSGGAESSLDGSWKMPLLIDNKPGTPNPFARMLFWTKPNGKVEYPNGASVIAWDDSGTITGITGNPEDNGGVRAFQIFLLITAEGRKTVDLLIMEDYSIKRVTRAEYQAHLQRQFTPPTLVPTPVEVGPTPDDYTPEPPPAVTPEPQTLEELLKQHESDLTPSPVP